MKIIKPDFYDEFKCIADKCPYNCCNNWGISIDNDTMEKYKTFTGSLGDKVINCIESTSQDGVQKHIMKLDKNGNCPFLMENGLCEIVIKKGEEYLSHTCTVYPRTNAEYANILEKSLYTSCPAVLDFLYRKKQINFISEGFVDSIEIFSDYDDKILFEADIRNFLIEILQLKDFPLWVKQYFVISLAKKTEPYYKNNDFDSLNKEICQYSDINYLNKYAEMLMRIEQNYPLKFKLLKKLYYEAGIDYNFLSKGKNKIADNLNEFFIDNMFDLYQKFDDEVYTQFEYFFENCCVMDMFTAFLKLILVNLTIYERCACIFIMYSLVKFTMFLYWYVNDYNITKKEQIDIISFMSRKTFHSNELFSDLCSFYEENDLFNLSYLFMILR